MIMSINRNFLVVVFILRERINYGALAKCSNDQQRLLLDCSEIQPQKVLPKMEARRRMPLILCLCKRILSKLIIKYKNRIKHFQLIILVFLATSVVCVLKGGTSVKESIFFATASWIADTFTIWIFTFWQ